MDEVDLRLCGLLIVNARTPYRELADRLGLSLQAVHRRIQVLQEEGVIRAFVGGLSFSYVNAVVVYVFGTSGARSMDQAVEALRKSDRTYIVLVSGRNYLSIGAILKDNSEMDEYLEFVRREALLSDVRVGLMSITQFGKDRIGGADREEGLTTLDYRIINALRGDARRPVEEVAAELEVSAATARRRLNRLIEIGAFSASIDWRPSASGQIIAQLYLTLKEGADRARVANDLMAMSSSRIISFISFANLPTFLMFVVWAASMRELSELTAQAAGMEGVETATPNVIISENRFDTWVDKMVARRAGTKRAGQQTEG